MWNYLTNVSLGFLGRRASGGVAFLRSPSGVAAAHLNPATEAMVLCQDDGTTANRQDDLDSPCSFRCAATADLLRPDSRLGRRGCPVSSVRCSGDVPGGVRPVPPATHACGSRPIDRGSGEGGIRRGPG